MPCSSDESLEVFIKTLKGETKMEYSKNINKALQYTDVCAILSSAFAIGELFSLYIVFSRNARFTQGVKPEFFEFASGFMSVPNLIFVINSLLLICCLIMAAKATNEFYRINICLKNKTKLLKLNNNRRFCFAMFIISLVEFCLIIFLFIIK